MEISPKSSQRQFSHTRFIFLLIIVLNTLDTKQHLTKPQNLYSTQLQQDIKYCEICFKTQLQQCDKFFKQIELDEEFSIRQLLMILPQGSSKRNNQMLITKNTLEKVIAKNFFKKNENLQKNFENFNFKETFLQKQVTAIDGMQFKPIKRIDNFVKILQNFHKNFPEPTIWLYMTINIQLVLIPLLYDYKFPVPKTYAICGFTMFQQNSGLDLYYFYKAEFHTKLKIAQQLLAASLKFSYGFDTYRLYITDLTADNIVYDASQNKLTFIDLDTIFIVDASQAKYKSSIHKHQYIECPGCFAYSPDDISSHNISDINIYSACQFLREDLYQQHTKGFLYPITEEISAAYPSLWQLLDKCVDCPDSMCQERFTVAKELIKLFKKILE